MNWGHNPVPKTTYPKGKKKKLEVYKGKSIPSNKTRSAISKKVYNQVIDEHGSVCLECGNPYVEIHHARFRSQGGKGTPYNLIPLCKIHHLQCHKSREYADKWREWLTERYGEYFWCDKYDLWKLSLIKDPTHELFDRFMEKEMVSCEQKKLR